VRQKHAANPGPLLRDWTLPRHLRDTSIDGFALKSGGHQDRNNVAGKLREGYELVRADEYPDFVAPSSDDGNHAGIIGVGGLLLARIPEETVEERNAYYRSRAKDQVEAADNDLLKTNAHDSMRIDRPVRQSKVQFGGPKAG
jgi:hypothetical protein